MDYKGKNFFIFLILFMACSGYAKLELVDEQTLFCGGQGGYACYRIPALCVAADGSILAFAEARRNGVADDGEIDLVLKRSLDNGKTWGKTETVLSGDGATVGNPVPILERRSGKIILLLTKTPKGYTEQTMPRHKDVYTRPVFVCESSDNGKTWSKPRDITKELGLKKGTWYATGPAGGIQINGGVRDGRLVVPFDIGAPHMRSGAIYSDDAGKTWKLGKWCDAPFGNECQIAQAGELLVLNMRIHKKDGPKYRRVALSADFGETWKPSAHDFELPEPVCQGALKSFFKDGKTWFLFSNPADCSVRKNMTLKRADADEYIKWFSAGCPQILEKPIWRESVSIYPAASSYSDIAVLLDGTVGVFYERGVKGAWPCDEMTFSRVRISE